MVYLADLARNFRETADDRRDHRREDDDTGERERNQERQNTPAEAAGEV